MQHEWVVLYPKPKQQSEDVLEMKIGTWKTHDGRVMLVSQMTDTHLANSIAMIHRGSDAKGRRVKRHTARLLPALEVEQEVRRIQKGPGLNSMG